MNQRQLFAGVILLGMVSGTSAFAQSYREEGIRIGSGEFKNIPDVAVGSSTLKAAVVAEGRYDSNVFLTSNNKKHDYISSVSPKLLWDVPFGIDQRHLIQVLYSAEAATFAKYKSQNYLDQNAVVNANLRLPWGYFDVQNNFIDTVDRADTEFTSQVHRLMNLTSTTLGVEINKLTYELGYAHFLEHYYKEEDSDLNYGEDDLSGTLFYQLFPKTKALLQYTHGIINYTKDNTRDGDSNAVLVGLKGDITGKTVGIVKAGYKTRDYKDSSQDGFSGFVSEAAVITSFTERTELELKYVQDVLESISDTSNYYNTHALTATLTQRIKNHFSLLVSSGCRWNNYPEVDPRINEKQQDTVLTQGVTLQYDLKERARISLGYLFLQRSSNIDTEEYNDNIISLRFTYLF